MDYQYNDYELVYMIKESNEDAFDIMLKKYDPIIKSLAFSYVKKYDFFNLDFDDLLQEGRISFYKSIIDYREEKDILFYTFCILCIKRTYSNYIRSFYRKYNYLLSDIKDMEDYDLKIPDKSCYEPSYLLDDCEVERKIIDFKNSLDLIESTIFELRFNNFKYNEIAILLDIKIKKVDNCMVKIKSKLKKYLLKI